MGTRSMTIFMEDNQELCRLYRQFDGYPEGHGLDLAVACNKVIVNGYSLEQAQGGFANGVGNLAVQVIAELANGIQEFHLEPPIGDINEWCEYIYFVRGKYNEKPSIECATQAGPFPNIQSVSGFVYAGTPDEWIAKYGNNLR